MTDTRNINRPRVVLAYSGSRATCAAIGWLAGTRGADVVTLTLDLGAGGELQEIHERALALGAVRAHVIDVRDEFADHYLLPALHAGALHPHGDTPQALARPLIAKTLVEVARIERATAVAHGAAADAGIETLIRALASDLEVIGAPQATANPVSPALSKPAAARVDNGADVEITFDRDVPVAINGVPMSLTELIESLTVIALQHGVPASANFVGAPAIAVLQAAFDARRREEITTAVRIRLQHGITTAAPVSSTELAATALLAARRS